MYRRRARRGVRLRLPSVYVLTALAAATGVAQPSFEPVVIDDDNPTNPHCKALGDIDGDDLVDGVVASSNGDGMYWYEYPDWDKHAIRSSGSWTTDMQVGDIDGDGDLDIVIPDSSGLLWYENPRPDGDPRTATWMEHMIGSDGSDNHDVEVADVDLDGDLDVVSRKKGGGGTYLWQQVPPATSWMQVTISSHSGEGISLGDIDGDGDLDVAQNRTWVEQESATTWVEHDIDSTAPHDVGVLVVDIDGNGTQDVVIGPSESSSGHLTWYEAIDPVAGPWEPHIIDQTVSYLHTFKAGDVDRDGDLDLVTAEMHQSADPDEVSVYYNNNQGTTWMQQVAAESGSHNVRAGDIGGDGDIDIFGANWNDQQADNSAVVEAWINQSAPRSLDQWQRYIVETSLEWRAVFVDGQDINGDGLPDLVAGGWWYPNPGTLGGTWSQQEIGIGLENMAAVHDFDRDGDLDILGTNGDHVGDDLAWAENDGGGSFTVHDITNAANGGDFLQGVSVFEILPGGQEEVVLSWHNGGNGTAILEVPADPTTTAWTLTLPVGSHTNVEQTPVGDLDGDGDVDIHLGDTWLRQDAGGTFSVQNGVDLGAGVPDRVSLADLDGDGDLDAVIGVEFADLLVWGENDGSGGGWTNRTIATDFDYLSVDVADFDNDGDIDVVGGAHQGNGEVSIYANNGNGTAWATHVVDSGDSGQIDHHDGTQVVDLDLDGDLDIVSIGWTKRSLVVYENLSTDGGGGGGDTTPPRIEAVYALGGGTPVVVDFDEPMNSASAENVANYSISGSVSVAGAELADNQRAVTLTTSPLSPGIEYTLTVSNVTDLAGNSIAPGSTVDFEVGLGEPLAGLVAHWPLDEGSGMVAVDVSGNGHHGLLTNGVEWGGSASFDGVDDYIDTGTFDIGGSALTLAAWISSDDLDNCSSNDCRILSKATGIQEPDHTFMLSTIDSGVNTRLRFRLRTGGSTSTLVADSRGNLAEDTWYHAAAVYDGAEMRLYLDGQEVGSMAKSGTITGAPAVPVWIGGNPGGGTQKPWDGLIDDVRIYGRALSAADLAQLPPRGGTWLFADGFDVNALAPWSGSSGAIEVSTAAVWSGIRGARLQAATDCTAQDFDAVPGPGPVSGTFEACRELSVGDVEVDAPATFRAGERVTIADGFSSAADFSVQIDPTLTPFHWLRDNSPSAETAYTADFQANLDNLTLGSGDRLEHFAARSGGESTFTLVLQPDGSGGVEAGIEARLDNGSVQTTPAGNEAAISSGWHNLRLVWTAGAGDGSLALFIDGAQALSFSNLDNGSRRVEAVFWGIVDGAVEGTSGTIDVDEFVSW